MDTSLSKGKFKLCIVNGGRHSNVLLSKKISYSKFRQYVGEKFALDTSGVIRLSYRLPSSDHVYDINDDEKLRYFIDFILTTNQDQIILNVDQFCETPVDP